jgi:hypothetical protein
MPYLEDICVFSTSVKAQARTALAAVLLLLRERKSYVKPTKSAWG